MLKLSFDGVDFALKSKSLISNCTCTAVCFSTLTSAIRTVKTFGEHDRYKKAMI